MNKVILFDKEIELNKTIYVTLDDDLRLFSMFPELPSYASYATSYNELCKHIKEGRDNIITPITKCVSSNIMEKGYDIIVQSKNKYIRFSDLLMGKSDGSNGREIRETQNWEKMLYSGCFDLDIPTF